MRKGWELKKLGEVSDFQGGSQPPKSNFIFEPRKGYVRFLQIRDFGNDKNITYIPESKNNRYCNEDDVLLGRYGASVGKVLTKKEGAYNVAVMKTLPNELIVSKRYFYYYLISNEFQERLSNVASRSAQDGFSKDDIYNFPILVPPLADQKQIVAVLDKSLSAIDKVKANAQKNLENVKELFESYLQNVFENPGKDWQEKSLGDVAHTNGRIGWKGLTAKEYTKKGPLFISVHSLNYGDYVDFKEAFHISQARYDESPEIMLRRDDILICKDGAGIGKLGIVPNLPSPATINSSLLLIRCKKEILSKYLYYNLLSPKFQSIVQSKLMGATTPHLYQRDIITFPILLPPISEQKIIIQNLEKLSFQTNRLCESYQQKLNNLDELKKSILLKAFVGELT